MKPFKYYKKIFKGLIIYTCDTDFRKYDYKPDLTIYKKGWFRDHENQFVLMITDIMKLKQERHKYYYFENLKQVNEFIKPLLN